MKAAGTLAQMTKRDSVAMAYAEGRMGIYGNFAARPSTPSRALLFTSIGCDELWGDWQSGRALRNGDLVAEGPNLCAPGTGKTNPYDSADWQFTAPIYYFQGPFDPTSTLAMARYHFESHARTRRTFVLVNGASHAPLSGGLAPCARRIWDVMVAAGELDQGLIDGCPRSAMIEARR